MCGALGCVSDGGGCRRALRTCFTYFQYARISIVYFCIFHTLLDAFSISREDLPVPSCPSEHSQSILRPSKSPSYLFTTKSGGRVGRVAHDRLTLVTSFFGLCKRLAGGLILYCFRWLGRWRSRFCRALFCRWHTGHDFVFEAHYRIRWSTYP